MTDDEIEDGITEELEPFVIFFALAGLLFVTPAGVA